MPRTNRPPSYRRHKARNCAVVTIDGQNRYLGPYGSPESYETYARLIANWKIGGANPQPATGRPGGEPHLSINELILTYWKFAKTYYVKDGEPTKELACMREALRPLRDLYSHTNAGEFGPKALKAVRQHMMDLGLCRGVVNHRISRIKRVFKWAVAEEMVPPYIHQGLQAVAGLRFGRTEAREMEPVKPVPEKWVNAVVPYVSPPVAAMIQIQQLTGVRPCEVVAMRPCDIDQSGDIWIYEPYDHKNRWRGHRRLIPLGPKAQQVLKPFLDRDAAAFLFSPREAEAWRNARRRKQRKTSMTPSQVKRKPKAKPKRPRRDHYDTDSYRQAIVYGIQKANRNKNGKPQVPHWYPLQIRHSRATEVRRRYRLEGAQAALGHARADISEIYAEKNMELARRIAREMG